MNLRKNYYELWKQIDIMFGIRLIRFRPISTYQNEFSGEECIMRFSDGRTSVGWYSDDDGWHYSNVADDKDSPCDPQPTLYARLHKI